MPRREQRTPPLNTAIERPTATTSGMVPGNRDVVRSPGADMDDNQSACAAGEAVAGVWGGKPGAFPKGE